jgi:hypothetical protein
VTFVIGIYVLPTSALLIAALANQTVGSSATTVG